MSLQAQLSVQKTCMHNLAVWLTLTILSLLYSVSVEERFSMAQRQAQYSDPYYGIRYVGSTVVGMCAFH
jgi:hypothetical protein